MPLVQSMESASSGLRQVTHLLAYGSRDVVARESLATADKRRFRAASGIKPGLPLPLARSPEPLPVSLHGRCPINGTSPALFDNVQRDLSE